MDRLSKLSNNVTIIIAVRLACYLLNQIEIRLKTMLKIESALVMMSFDNRRDESSRKYFKYRWRWSQRQTSAIRKSLVLFYFLLFLFHFFSMLSFVCHEKLFSFFLLVTEFCKWKCECVTRVFY